MQPQPQMQKKAVGELIALESILVLPRNMKLVWVTYIVFLGWKTGILSSLCIILLGAYDKRGNEKSY